MKIVRHLIGGCLAMSVGLVAHFPIIGTAGDVPSANSASKMLRDASIMLLKEGNERFVAGKSQHPNLQAERRNSTVAEGQEPFATVLGCADSRGPIELLFDRGIGDLFIVRVAGNIAGESELASLEYGVGHLNTPVLVVLGHTKCGAVTAVTQGAELHGHLHILAEQIEPAAQKARDEATGANDLIPRAIQANVWNTMERVLRESSVIRDKVVAKSAQLVGAIYDLESGQVSWLGGHPAQDAIIALANQAPPVPATAGRKEASAQPVPSGSKKSSAPAPATNSLADLFPQLKAERPPAAKHGTTSATGTNGSSGKSGKTGHGLVGGPAHAAPAPKSAEH